MILSVVCAVFVASDIVTGHRQKMAIMDVVWPLTGLWGGPLGLLLYLLIGRETATRANSSHRDTPFAVSVLKGTLHCGAGCTLGDFAGEWIVFLTGFSLSGSILWANYAVDFTLAFLAGIVFQYFAIAPMRNISGWAGVKAAVKADSVSLIAYEIGMFLWMAFASRLFHPELKPNSPVYWYMMQIAMLAGLITSYPANWLLLRIGLKEKM